MEIGTAAGNHHISCIDSGENLDILRRLDAGVYIARLYLARAVNQKEPLAVSRAIDSLGWNRSSIRGPPLFPALPPRTCRGST